MAIRDEMRAFIKEIEQTAVENVKIHGDHVPMVFGKVGDELRHYVIVPAPNMDTGLAIKNIAEMLAMEGAEWIVVVGSFYMRMFEDEEEAKRYMQNYKYGSLGEDSESEEILLITGFSIIGDKELVAYKVKEDVDGRKLEKTDLGKNAEAFSRFNPFEQLL